MRLLILIGLISLNFTYAQVAESVTLRGVEYQFVGDSNAEYRVSGDYSSVDSNDLETYLHVFVRDAIVNGQDLDLSVDTGATYGSYFENGVQRFVGQNSLSFINYPRGRENIGASSFGSRRPGYAITVNRSLWDGFSEIKKRTIMYHEFGHALFLFDHLCEATGSWVRVEGGAGRDIIGGIMYDGTCHNDRVLLAQYCNGLVGYPLVPECDTGPDFRIWETKLNHFYNNFVSLGDRVSSKGADVIHD